VKPLNQTPISTGPLAGVKVLDLTTVVMGPYATQLLGDLGADVIKIEEAGGDLSRAMGPGPHPELSGTALNLHRNKRSILLDLKDPVNRPTIEGLIRQTDVFVTNLRPGPLKRLGLDHAKCVAIHPEIVFCQAQGWPTDSPEGDRPAYDDIIQSATGVADLMERTTGVTGLFPSIIADKICGQTIASSIIAALFYREKTGVGQRVEVPMYETMLAFQLVEHLSGATTEPPLSPPGYARIVTPQRGPKRAKDGWITLLPYDTKHWEALLAVEGRESELTDPRFATAPARAIHADALYSLLSEIISTRTVAEWIEICASIGVSAEPVRSLTDAIESSLKSGGIRIAEHPITGAYRQVLPAVRFDATPQNITRHAPLIGEHTQQILEELRLSETPNLPD
jgi:crotonobetainyl-CoA:carnitine CoA-transferase CaiB-like acyl-CoA transferase